MKNVLIIVDMQNDFIDGALPCDKEYKVVNNVIREIKSNKYDYMFLTRDSHLDNYLNTLEGKNLPIVHCITGSKGWETNRDVLNAVIESNIPHSFYEKNGFGTFKINELLEESISELESITVIGLCTDICVITMSLILRAKFPNTPMYIVEDACAGTSLEAHKSALEVMKCCQIYTK